MYLSSGKQRALGYLERNLPELTDGYEVSIDQVICSKKLDHFRAQKNLSIIVKWCRFFGTVDDEKC
jgi:hypothetical protein